jgi:hypothetical protein
MCIFINQFPLMKRLAILCCSLLLFSCENTWDSEAKNLFHQGCMESSLEGGMEQAAAKSMCDCRLEKAMKKYPSFADAMENADKLMEDEDLKACK